MIPIVGLVGRATPRRRSPHPRRRPRARAGPLISPTARPPIAAGKMTSIPSRCGSTIASPSVTPANVARFHGIRVVTIAGYQ